MTQLCVVVPYRNREEHLGQFVPLMRKFINSEFELLVVEQADDKPFNRAKLLNVGFHYTEGKYLNYCFHDVDMLPEEADYSTVDRPTHLASRVEQFNWSLPYDSYFGGVTTFDNESFKKINGYSNEYWGWGAEDDDVFNRCLRKNIFPQRKACSFKSLFHERHIEPSAYQKNVEKLNRFQSSMNEKGDFIEGLSTLEYETISCEKLENYTLLKVKL